MPKFEMYPTIITPYCEDGSIDDRGLENLVAMFAAAGCDGVFAVCQSSEMFFLTEAEKLALAARSIEYCRKYGIKCVVSGHTQDAVADQIAYLQALEQLSPDAIILVSNRFAAQDEPESVAVATMQQVIGALKPETRLGVYECPYPYKRLMTPELIDAMIVDGRFDFIKDTCCCIEEIRRRLKQLEGHSPRLYNANSATLLESVDAGATGYSGIQLNISPDMFTLLKDGLCSGQRARAEAAFSFIAGTGYIECQNYPTNAKYLLKKRGLISTTITRTGKPPLNESQTKELESFVQMERMLYHHLLPREDVQLMFRRGDAFPECHASTVLPLDDGRVLSVYFAGTREKCSDVGIWLSEYANGGWLAPRCIVPAEGIAHWNPVIYADSDVIRVLFKIGREITEWRSYTIASADGGRTWSAPEALNADNPAGGPVRNKPLRLADGRMLAPNSDETACDWLPRVDESTDGGATFRKLADIPLNRTDVTCGNYLQGKGAIQPTLWESAPGRVHALLRTTAGQIFRSDSADGGRSWCTAYPAGLPNNNSGIDLTQVGNVLYLVMNPVSGNWAARTPLMVMRSVDNGAHFSPWRVLADNIVDDQRDVGCEFSYPAIVAKDGMLHITFTWDRFVIAYCCIKAE